MTEIRLEREALAPLVRQIVQEALRQLEETRAQVPPGRLAYSEAEAAALLGLESHQLRDARYRGEIQASVGPGRKILYLPQDLIEYLQSRRWDKDEAAPRASARARQL